MIKLIPWVQLHSTDCYYRQHGGAGLCNTSQGFCEKFTVAFVSPDAWWTPLSCAVRCMLLATDFPVTLSAARSASVAPMVKRPYSRVRGKMAAVFTPIRMAINDACR